MEPATMPPTDKNAAAGDRSRRYYVVAVDLLGQECFPSSPVCFIVNASVSKSPSSTSGTSEVPLKVQTKMMNRILFFTLVLSLCIPASETFGQKLTADIPYVESGHKRHVLDIYTPDKSSDKSLPVMFWIHGGGWQAGDKNDVALKPKVLTERGFVFVSTNYRLLPEITMDVLIADIAKSLGWVHGHIAEYGGDPQRIFVGGHSAGAQLAALICTDDRYLKKEGVSFDVLKGCIPVDGDTYDIPKIIMTAEFRQMLYGGKMFSFGHRQKFGNDPDKHVDFSAVTHVGKGKGIPPFLILYFPGNPNTSAQARRLESVLKEFEIPTKAFGNRDSNHSRLNNDLGKPDDPATIELYRFLDPLISGL
jgi:arylformamidase